MNNVVLIGKVKMYMDDGNFIRFKLSAKNGIEHAKYPSLGYFPCFMSRKLWERIDVAEEEELVVFGKLVSKRTVVNTEEGTQAINRMVVFVNRAYKVIIASPMGEENIKIGGTYDDTSVEGISHLADHSSTEENSSR